MKLLILPVAFAELLECGYFFMEKRVLSEAEKKYVEAAIIIFFVYLAMKYISPIVSPFIFALLLAGILNPIVLALHQRLKVRKSILTGIILFIGGVVVAGLMWLIVSLLVSEGSKIAYQIPSYQDDWILLLEDCCDNMEKRFGIKGVEIENFVMEQANVLVENLEVKILPAVMGKSVDYMKNIVSFVSFLVIMMIAVLLMMKDYDRLVEKFKKDDSLKGIREVGDKVVIYVKTFVKAQIIILCIISTICALTLGLMGMQGGVFYGILTGVMDMLPFIGTGIMLLPLVLFNLINGEFWRALCCFLLYAVCAFIREFLEPKLIGEQTGVWPVGILFAVFAGLRLFGVWGIIKGPLALVIICEICKYLWSYRNREGKE